MTHEPFVRPELNVDDVTVTYNNGHTAIHNASFTLSGGSICALVGVNGSGKSTLFKSIMGLVRPTAGQVSLSDKPVADALKKNLIAYVPQTEDVDWNFPVLVEDVVMMGRYGKMNFLRIPSREDRLRVDKALERVGLSELRGRQIGELSGGQKKRVFLARALAQQGTVLLLDEPFTGVDVKTENAIIELLRAARRGPSHFGLHPQPRQRAGILRSGDPHQPHGAGRRPDRDHLHTEQPGAGVRRRAAPYQPFRPGSARRQRSAHRHGVDRR